MFICGVCGKQSKPGEKPVMTVLETRVKVYPAREWAGDPGGEGREVVRDVLTHKVCPNDVR